MACGGANSDTEMDIWNNFSTAVEKEDTKTIQQYINHPQVIKKNPIELAVNLSKNKSLDAMLHLKLSPSKSCGPTLNTPLHIAVLKNNLQGIKILMSHGADIEKFNIYGYTPFSTALECGNEDIICFFTENYKYWKKDLNFVLWTDEHRHCPLFCLLKNQKLETIRYFVRFLQNGVSPNKINARGNTPLLEAMYTKNDITAATVVRSMIKFGADVNFFNNDGICPLFKAVTLDKPILVQALMDSRNLDINMVNMFRLTPLFYAVANSKNLEIARILMKAGADPTITGSFTMRGHVVDVASALLMAVVNERYQMLSLFLDYGYPPKRKWFRSNSLDSVGWNRSKELAKLVPTLKSLTRKTIRTEITKKEKLPTKSRLSSLDIPLSLREYIAFY